MQEFPTGLPGEMPGDEIIVPPPESLADEATFVAAARAIEKASGSAWALLLLDHAATPRVWAGLMVAYALATWLISPWGVYANPMFLAAPLVLLMPLALGVTLGRMRHWIECEAAGAEFAALPLSRHELLRAALRPTLERYSRNGLRLIFHIHVMLAASGLVLAIDEAPQLATNGARLVLFVGFAFVGPIISIAFSLMVGGTLSSYLDRGEEWMKLSMLRTDGEERDGAADRGVGTAIFLWARLLVTWLVILGVVGTVAFQVTDAGAQQTSDHPWLPIVGAFLFLIGMYASMLLLGPLSPRSVRVLRRQEKARDLRPVAAAIRDIKGTSKNVIEPIEVDPEWREWGRVHPAGEPRKASGDDPVS